MLDVSNEASRGHVVLWVPEERTSQSRGHGTQRKECEDPERLPVRALHRRP